MMLLSLFFSLMLRNPAQATSCSTNGQLAGNGSVVTACQNSVLTTVKGSTITSCAGTAAGTTAYSAGTYQICDGSNWYTMKGSLIGSCAGTTAGTLTYSSSAFQFCDGSNWYGLAALSSVITSPSCGGYSCHFVSSGDTNANGVCISAGFTSAISSTSGGSGCNNCYYTDWNGSSWGAAYNHCNSCNVIAQVTCQ